MPCASSPVAVSNLLSTGEDLPLVASPQRLFSSRASALLPLFVLSTTAVNCLAPAALAKVPDLEHVVVCSRGSGVTL